MNNKYFNNISTLEELRKQYKELLKLHRPDNGGEWKSCRKSMLNMTDYSSFRKIGMKIIIMLIAAIQILIIII